MTIKVLETSVSQLIKDIDPFEVKQAIGECKSNLDKATKVEHLGSKSYLMHLCLRRHSYYFVYSTDTKAIDYFVRYREVDLGRLLPVKPGRLPRFILRYLGDYFLVSANGSSDFLMLSLDRVQVHKQETSQLLVAH